MIEIQGHCEPEYKALKQAFAENFEAGRELGASLAAIDHTGALVCDIWAGFADRARTEPWQQDSLAIVFSSTKIPTTLAAWLLVDRGLLDWDTPVAEYWPEFAQNGKDKLLVRHVLSHQSGLPGFDEVVKGDELFDWDYVISLLEQQAPWFEPGTEVAYQAVTYGFLVGELVRRVSGKTIAEYVREEIAEPLKADISIGLPQAHRSRGVQHLFDEGRDWDEYTKVSKYLERADASVVDVVWTSRIAKAAIVPSANGWTNARSLAKLGAIVAHGGALNDTRLISQQTLDHALTETSHGIDQAMGMSMRWAHGLWLSAEEFPFYHDDVVLGAGYGGSFMYMDRTARACCAYVPNHLVSNPFIDDREGGIKDAWNACIQNLEEATMK